MKTFQINGVKFVRYFGQTKDRKKHDFRYCKEKSWVLFIPRTGEHLHADMLVVLRSIAKAYSGGPFKNRGRCDQLFREET